MQAPLGRTDTSQLSGDPAPQTPTGSNTVDKAFDTIDKALDLTNTLVATVEEVAEALQHAPYVKMLTGVILQFIKIRDELKRNKMRCREIIDKVLTLSHWICDKLAAIAKSGERAKENLAQVENSFVFCAITLTDVLGELKKHQARSKLVKIVSRGLDDLTGIDRSVDNLEQRLLRDMLFDIKLQHAVSSRNMDPPSHPLTDNLDHVLPLNPLKEKTTEDSFLIRPNDPSRAKGNPFAYAQVNNLSGQVRKEYTIGGGSFADVHMGYWVTDTTSIKVAIKELRSQIYSQENVPKFQKRLKREMRIWGNLDHPNIVSLLGITFDFGKSIAMVCQWMDQGALSEYLEKEKDNLSLRDRLNMCIAVAGGLSYLHSKKVVHGDLTPANILMDNGTAHLSDFGLSNVIEELQGTSFCTSMVGGSARWIAPELLHASKLTTSCDVYSFGSVAFYVITGMLPYSHINKEHAIVAEIFRSTDKCPSRPAQSPVLTDECWEILTMCWATDPAERPDINDVNRRLQQLVFLES